MTCTVHESGNVRYKNRWHAVAKCSQQINVRENGFKACWNARRYSDFIFDKKHVDNDGEDDAPGADDEDDSDHETAGDTSVLTVTELQHSTWFFGFNELCVEVLQLAVTDMAQWCEGCPCHRQCFSEDGVMIPEYRRQKILAK